jgi:hypothetical protein
MRESIVHTSTTNTAPRGRRNKMEILGTYYKTFRPEWDGYRLQERILLMVRTTDGDFTVKGLMDLVDSGYPVEVAA